MKLEAVHVMATSVVIRWQSFRLNDERELLSWIVHYRKVWVNFWWCFGPVLRHVGKPTTCMGGPSTRASPSILVFPPFFSFIALKSSRGHPYELSIPLAKLNTRKFFFSNRVILAWNTLPADVVVAQSNSAFKHCVRKIDLSKFLIFQTD